MKCKYKKFLKAAYINYEEDYCGHGSGTFTKPTVTTPIIVITGTTAIIACAISGATIYYTLDGSTPTSSSTEYTGTITLTLNCTIKAIAVKPGMSDSDVASESYVHYLTQWKIVGNSEVHTDPYLTSWKVSGNSIVDNNTILSCGDLGQDGKYHVKISNGVTIYDIPLDAPLRKVNNVADTIEFPSGVEIVRFASYFNIPLSNINYALRNYNFYDYMSSTDTSGQYIDTGLRIGGTDSVDFRVKFFLQNAGGWFGAFDGDNYVSPGYYGTDLNSQKDVITLNCGGEKAFYNCSITSLVDISLCLIKTYAFTKIPTFNGVNGTVSRGELSNATYTPTHNAFIFARNNAGTPSSTRLMSVYSLIVHGKGVFVVAKRKSDNAIGLLNLLDSNPATQLHTNQGSGNDFTLGSQITFEQLCLDIMEDYPDAPTVTSDKALLTIRVEESGEELLPLDTPTTELIDVSPFPVSPTDIYTSANVVPYSAFEHTENKEIWSCGEYNATDGKYHILVQPLGGSIADIALDEPLRKVNDVADTIEFPSETEGKALVTRNLISIDNLDTLNTWSELSTGVTGKVRWRATDYATQLKPASSVSVIPNILCSIYPTINSNTTYDWRTNNKGVNVSIVGNILIIDEDYSASKDYDKFIEHLNGVELIGELATPTTELVDAPQIEEADSYSMVIGQGGKAVSWSSFITE